MSDGKVKFIRKNGRVIPIREGGSGDGGSGGSRKKGGGASKGIKARINVTSRNRGVGERTAHGMKRGAVLGGVLGAVEGAFSGNARSAAVSMVAGVVGGAAAGGLFHAAFGSRKQHRITIKAEGGKTKVRKGSR